MEFWTRTVDQAHAADDAADDAAPQPLVAPGKVTRTLDLPPRAGSPAVQRRAADATTPNAFTTRTVARVTDQIDVAEGGPDAVHAVATDGVAGGGDALPFLDVVQRAFGRHDVRGLRAHVGGAAADAAHAIGARAYTTGIHIAFAQAPDLHTVAHEAAHAIQQRGGVQLTGGVGVAGDAYERHADLVADAVVRGESVEALLDPFAGILPGAPAAAPVQRKGEREADGAFVAFQIVVDRPMTPAEFEREVKRQVFGDETVAVTAAIAGDEYLPEHSPYTVQVAVKALRRRRLKAAGTRGIAVGADGEIAGATGRAQAFRTQAHDGHHAALVAEIDRRYGELTRAKPGARIASATSERAELWRAIRDEVLFEREYLGALPTNVRTVLRAGVRGRDLAPADYEQLFRVAKQIEAMPVDHLRDYLGKVGQAAASIDDLEVSLARHAAAMTTRDRESAEREAVKTDLAGLEGLYRLYRAAERTAPSTPYVARRWAADKAEFERQLDAYGFGSVAQFKRLIHSWEQVFEIGAAGVAGDLLERYDARLQREAGRYQSTGEVRALHEALAPLRSHQAAYEQSRDQFKEYVVAMQTPAFPSGGRLPRKPSHAEGAAAAQRATVALAAERDVLRALAAQHPVFQEDDLPEDQRISKTALAHADEHQLAGVLAAYIARRLADIADVQRRLASKRALIYKMDKLFPRFYAQLGVAPGSVFDMIVEDKRRDVAGAKLIDGLVVAIAAVALSVVSAGAATPAAVAAVTATAGFGLGAYSAYQEYQDYAEQGDLADVGAASRSSSTWLVVSMLGAGLDLAPVAKAARALAPAAQVFEATGDLAGFAKAVAALEKAGQIEARAAQAAHRAAAARKEFVDAAREFGEQFGAKVGSFPGALTAPETRRALVRLAKATIRAGYYSADEFFRRMLANGRRLEDLAPEDLAAAKSAWQEALERAPHMIDVSDKVVPTASGFRLNRKAIRNVEKIIGDPEATIAEHAAREAAAAELAASLPQVERVYLGKEADRFINGTTGTLPSVDVVAVTRRNTFYLVEAKGRDITKALHQLRLNAVSLGSGRIERMTIIIPDELSTPGYTVVGGRLFGAAGPALIDGKPVWVKFTNTE